MWASPLLRVLLVILRPLNFLFSQWKRLLSHIIRPADAEGITEEELITMVSEAENEGGLDQHESQLIRSAIEFGDLEAGDILTPRWTSWRWRTPPPWTTSPPFCRKAATPGCRSTTRMWTTSWA